MSKIHTHYDNLKVSRMAPPEVIRAAYKALSQKYHPDKNPGDEKAARIMAILNSAYGSLSDPQRRKEHDEWIAAEEWEIEWLESTRLEEEAKNKDDYQPQWVGGKDKADAYRRRTDPQWWLMLLLCLALGWGAAVLMQMQFNFMPTLLPQAVATQAIPLENKVVNLASSPVKPVETKLVVSSQLNLTGVEKPCSLAARPDTAPNGENWPAKSGYIDGYKAANAGSEMKLLLDNSANHSDSFVILFDREKHLAVRYLFLRAQEKFNIDNLLAGNYEVQQQVLGPSANVKSLCDEAGASVAVPSPTPSPTPTATTAQGN
mgnify:CR=1 FL=1